MWQRYTISLATNRFEREINDPKLVALTYSSMHILWAPSSQKHTTNSIANTKIFLDRRFGKKPNAAFVHFAIKRLCVSKMPFGKAIVCRRRNAKADLRGATPSAFANFSNKPLCHRRPTGYLVSGMSFLRKNWRWPTHRCFLCVLKPFLEMSLHGGLAAVKRNL